MTENTHAGRLIVLTGPTAVGKGTVEAKLRADHPEVWVSVSATTRAPRPGEVDGVNYWFLTEDEFLAREAAGEFLETAVVHGMAHYGTLLKPVEEHLAAESEFDVTIVNETVDQAAADLWSVIAKEYGL